MQYHITSYICRVCGGFPEDATCKLVTFTSQYSTKLHRNQAPAPPYPRSSLELVAVLPFDSVHSIRTDRLALKRQGRSKVFTRLDRSNTLRRPGENHIALLFHLRQLIHIPKVVQ